MCVRRGSIRVLGAHELVALKDESMSSRPVETILDQKFTTDNGDISLIDGVLMTWHLIVMRCHLFLDVGLVGLVYDGLWPGYDGIRVVLVILIRVHVCGVLFILAVVDNDNIPIFSLGADEQQPGC